MSQLRAAVTLLVLTAVALIGLGRSAEARLGERLLGFGHGLLLLESFRASSAPRRLSVNGLELGVLTLSTSLDVSSALDPFQSLCERNGAVPGLDGVLRRESASEGVIACLDTGGELDLSELVRRLEAFRDSGDLAKIGALRYVMAKRDASRTTLLVLWTEGALPLLHAFPREGDAPGRDPEGVPRPDGVRRLFSAVEHGAPYALTLYGGGARSAAELLAWYGGKLEQKGWSVSRKQDASLLVARRAGRVLVVSATDSAGETSVGLAEL
jgi:hypothetical protein